MVWYGMVWPDRSLGDHHEELRDPGVRECELNSQLHALWYWYWYWYGIGRELNRCRSFPGVHVLFKGAHVFRRERPGPVGLGCDAPCRFLS